MEFLLSVDTLSQPTKMGFTFMGNALRTPGAEKIVEIMLAVVTSLSLDCAVLLSEGLEEQETERRTLSGESLLQILLGRLENSPELGPPKLTLVRSELLTASAHEGARNVGLKVRTVLGGYTMFSSVHEGS